MEDLILRRISQFPVTKVERVAPDAIRLVSEWFTTEVRIKDGKIVMEHAEIDLTCSGTLFWQVKTPPLGRTPYTGTGIWTNVRLV